MSEAAENFRNRDFWTIENTQYANAGVRLQKCARLINDLAGNREFAVLDVGCGPAALKPLISPNIRYYGVDIAIHQPFGYLRELDIARERIAFEDKRFDCVVALGLIEYIGHRQKRKFEEISEVLKDDGKFLMTYTNFAHFNCKVWPIYNNVQSIEQMTESVKEVFQVERRYPAYHHWRPKQPGKNALPGLQTQMNINVTIISPLLAVEYFFVCSRRK